MMEGSTIAALISACASVAMFLLALYMYRAGARKEETATLSHRIDAVAGDLAEHKTHGQASRQNISDRLSQVESTLETMPRQATVHELALNVESMRGDIREQGATLKAVAATASRIDDYLRNGSGAK